METEIHEEVEGSIKEKSENNEEERREELLRIPFSIHDWNRYFRLTMLESEADRLQREYEALETIHEYSKRIESLKEQMESENLNSQDESFEIETESETFQNIDILDELNPPNEESCRDLEVTHSETNSEINANLDQEFSGSECEFSEEISEGTCETSGSSISTNGGNSS